MKKYILLLRISLVAFCFLLFNNSSKAWCSDDFFVYQIDPYGQLCSPQVATVRAEYFVWNSEGISGEFRWYASNTDLYPLHTDYINSYLGQLTSDNAIWADNGVEVWVSFYDYSTGCESQRIVHTFSVSPTPSLFFDYGRQCRESPAQVQVSSDVTGVVFELYKLYEYFDPFLGNIQSYQFEQSNSTGYFEIQSFNPADYDKYYIKILNPGGCSNLYYYPILIESTSANPPVISGALTINAGNATTLTASGYAHEFRWYAPGAGLVNVGWQYITPIFTNPGSYNYTIQGISSYGTCSTDPITVTVNVVPPDITYSPLYNSSNFIKTIDLSKPVGTVGGSPNVTPSGAATYAIPIYTSPGTNGLEPSISIVYNSMSGNGILGKGWNISGLSAITRAGKNIYNNGIVSPVEFTNQDGFILDGTKLNPVTGVNGANGTIYSSEIENFSKIISYGTSSDNPFWFSVTHKDGTIMEYGNSPTSKFQAENGQSVMMWRLSKVIDVNGNYIEYKYENGLRDSRIDEIVYTGNQLTGLQPYNKLKFNYETRADRNTTYEGGASVNTRHLLKTIIVTSEGSPVKNYDFNYGFDNIASFLKEVIEIGSDGASLNSTIFLYGDQPQNPMTVQPTYFLQGPYDFYPGDFDADGKSDLLVAESYLDQAMNTRLHSKYSLFQHIGQTSAILMYDKTLPQNTGSEVKRSEKGYFNFLAADYNGDGRDDVMQVRSSADDVPVAGELGFPGCLTQTKRKINGITINLTKSHNPSTGVTDHLEQNFGVPSDIFGNQYQYTKPAENFFIPGDFNGDGNKDYILILAKKRQIGTCGSGQGKYAFDYKAFITSPSTNEENKEIVGFGFGPNPSEYYAWTVADADNIVTLDFDGDGKDEVFVTKNTLSYILKIQLLPPSTGQTFASTVVYSTSEISSNSKIFSGDFNADRKTDILVRNSNGTWKILYATGTGYSQTTFTFNQTPNITGTGYDKVIISDFNGDGFSDILHAFPTGTYSTKFSMYYYRGNNNTTPFYYEQYDYFNTLSHYDLPVGDFNGDGRSDLINRHTVSEGFPSDFISFKEFAKEQLLVKVTNGHNATIEFEYKNLTQKGNFPYFYDRSISLDDPSNLNPFNYVQVPLNMVSAFKAPNGLGGTKRMSYRYEDAIIHRTGKGFLGFKKFITTNEAFGTSTTSENQLNFQFAFLYNVKESTTLISNGQLISETITTSSTDNLSTSSLEKRYYHKIDKILSINHLEGTASESSNTYDNYGNITITSENIGTLSGSTVIPIESTTTSSTYGSYNTPVPAKPNQITESKTRSGAPTKIKTVVLNYFPNGLLSSRVDFSGQPKAVTTNYSYNTFGNTSNVTISSTGITGRSTNLTFDSKGRFMVLSVSAAGASTAQTESFTYDYKWGTALSKTTSDCIITNYVYDGFGRLTQTSDPVMTFNNSFVWDVQGQNVFYEYTDYPGGEPDSKLWYDVLGRETKREVLGFQNQWLTNNLTYDVKGNLSTSSNSYYSNETPIITTNTYDAYNRIKTVSNSINTFTYTYNQLPGGNFETVISDLTGQTTSKTRDASGRIVSSNDQGGDLYYFYDSYGNQSEVKHGSTILMSSTFDIYGRQLTSTDKNSGTTTYEYDAIGQLIKQTDNAGHVYVMSYDELGRTASKQGPEGSTTYEYFNDVSTGCSNNNLKKITGFNNVVMEYTYDNLKRLQSELVTIDGVTYTTQYGYDSYGKPNKIIYPSGIEINKVYNNSGQLYIVTGGNPGSQHTLFYGSQKNGYGRFTNYTLGNSKSTQITYQNGLPTRYYTQAIQDLNLNFDFAKGNLLSRTESIKNISETFQYDALNRLTQASVNGQLQFNTSYDGTSNFSMGNIISKTDAGNYVYKNDKIHAIAYVTNPAGASPVTHSTTEQTVTYTPFLKTATISEAPFEILFTYGPDYERLKSVLKNNNVITETKYYLGNYEKQIDNNGAREIHYVEGGEGLCAIIVKENGVNNIYATYTDHLGSILTITDISGNVVAEQNFDAWGRKRNPQNWTYNGVPSVPSWLFRGYTSHEHLPQFGLINMNGRMYDPVFGRMLSPDNYVANPLFTQSYNRYTYANNNPLVYLDPDGDNPVVFGIIIGTLAGAYMGGIVANNEMDPFKWKSENTVGYVLAGAIIGAASGYLGGIVAVSGMPFANTAGIMAGSFANSMAWNVLTGGRVPVNIGFGAASYQFQKGTFGYLFKNGNSTLENIGYFFGALANLQDIVAGIRGVNVDYRAEGENGIPHGKILGTSKAGAKAKKVNDINVSVEHVDADPDYWYNGSNKILNGLDYAQAWIRLVVKGKWMEASLKLRAKFQINNVNGKWLANVTKRISEGRGKWGIGNLKYGSTIWGCQSHVGQALWGVGIPTLPINIHPFVLFAQLAVRQAGIYSSGFLINK